MVEVQVKEKESFERALRRFKKMWERAGVLREIRTRSFYEKPSDAKREARKKTCSLYTSDAADETPCVDLGGWRHIKKKNNDQSYPAS